MAENMEVWLKVIKEQVSSLADEDFQRRAWFGLSDNEIGSPDESFNSFLGDAAVSDFLTRSDTGLDQEQYESLKYLVTLMEDLTKETPQSIDKEIGPSFLYDPRWKRIIEAAKHTDRHLSK